MFCQYCGSQNPDGVGFCSNCGAALTPYANPVAAPVYTQPPMQQGAPVSTLPPVTPLAPVTMIPQQKRNILCNVGFFCALLSWPLMGIPAIPALIISIMGLISSQKNNERGRGFAIAGIIISLVFIITGIVAVVVAIINNNIE